MYGKRGTALLRVLPAGNEQLSTNSNLLSGLRERQELASISINQNLIREELANDATNTTVLPGSWNPPNCFQAVWRLDKAPCPLQKSVPLRPALDMQADAEEQMLNTSGEADRCCLVREAL